MGDPIKAEKIAKHFAAPVSSALKSTPFGKRSVPDVPAVKFNLSVATAARTFGNSAELFLLRSVAIDPPKSFVPKECLEFNPVEGSHATSHGHMGIIYFPKGQIPGAINCGVETADSAKCAADISALIDALAERMAGEMKSPLQFFKDYNKGCDSIYGKAADKAKGAWEGAKGAFNSTVDYFSNKTVGGMLDDAKGVYDGAVSATTDAIEEAVNISKLSLDEIKAICKEWLKEMLAEATCEVRDLLGEMAGNPQSLAEQMGEMQASIKLAAAEAAGAVVADVFVTKGAASAATKVGKVIGKLGPKLKGLGEKFKSALKRKQEGKHPATESAPKPVQAEQPKPVQNGDHNKGRPAEGQPQCQLCPLANPHPVNPIYGTKVLNGESELDFVLDGPLPLAWQRTYVSGNADTGWLGQGWSLPIAFRLDIEDRAIVFVDTQGRRTPFPPLAVGEQYFSKYEHTTLKRNARNEYEVISPDGLRLVFGLTGPQVVAAAKEDEKEAQRAARDAAVEAKRQARQAVGMDGKPAPDDDNTIPLPIESADRRLPQADSLLLRAMIDPNDNRIELAWRKDGLPHSLIDSTGRKIAFHFADRRLRQVIELHGKPRPDGSYPDAQCELIVQYAYSPQGDLIAVSDAFGNTVRSFQYHNHLLIEHAEPGGIVSRYVWDQTNPKGRVIRNTVNTGESWDFVYDDIARQTSVTDASGRRTVYHFDEEQRFTGITDPLGGFTERKLDGYGNLLALIDPAGRATRYQYDAQCNLVRIEQADGAVTRLDYHPAHRKPIAITDALGNTTRLDYDARGNLIEQTGPGGARTQYRLNARGLPMAIVDARGGAVTLDYDAAWRIIGVTDCSGNTTHYAYDQRNNLAHVTDAHGGRTAYEYERINRQDRVVRIVHPDYAEERFGYDPLGRMIAHHDALGQVTHYKLDAAGRPVERRNALGHSLRYLHDLHGRLTGLVNEAGAQTRFAYDPLDRLIAEQGFDGRRTDYRYDQAGNLIESADGARPGAPLMSGGPHVLRTWFKRDAMGRLVEKLSVKPGIAGRPQVARNRFLYDAAGQLVQARNQSARIDLHYGASGQLLREITRTRQGQESTLQHAYGILGNRIATTLPDGRVLNHLTYGSGHVHQINLDGEVIADIERDKLHREKSRTQGALASRYQRDGLGRLLGSAAYVPGHDLDPWAGEGAPGQASNRQSMAPPPSGSRIVRRYEYDKLGQLLKSEDARRGTTAYRYDPLGRLTAAQRRGGEVERFAFDPAHNLADPAQEQDDPRYKKAKTSYSQEEWAALVKANLNNPRFNPLQASSWGPQDPTSWGEYKPNHVLVWQEHRYRYDAWGNCIGKRSGAHIEQAFEWDAQHQLTRATITKHGKTETWAYEYDPFGRRIAKYQIDGVQRGGKPGPKPDSVIRFTWDGNRLLSEQQQARQTLYVYEPDSFIPLALVRTTQVPQALPPDPPFAIPLAWLALRDSHPDLWQKAEAMQRKTASKLGIPFERMQAALPGASPQRAAIAKTEVFYVHADHLGTPLELTDEQGQLVWSAHYKAWGRVEKIEYPPRIIKQTVGNTVREAVEEQADPVVQNLRFQGQYFDDETGLHYNRFRYYDPDIGRFVSQDPIGLNGGVNLYLYAPNPIGWIDPLGLKKRCQTRKNSTEPALPEKVIASEGGMRLEHYVRSGDHAPAHFHLRGEGGVNIQIGQNGKPIDSNVQLSAAQQGFVERNKAILRRSVDKIQRWHRYQNLPGDCSCCS